VRELTQLGRRLLGVVERLGQQGATRRSDACCVARTASCSRSIRSARPNSSFALS
jgi:hypothetical protein